MKFADLIPSCEKEKYPNRNMRMQKTERSKRREFVGHSFMVIGANTSLKRRVVGFGGMIGLIAIQSSVAIAGGYSTGSYGTDTNNNICSSTDVTSTTDQGTWTCMAPTNTGGFVLATGVAADYPTIGHYNFDGVASGQQAIAIGDLSTSAAGNYSIAVGIGANSSADNTVALGAGATASTENSVALGAGSLTSDLVATTGTTIKGVNYNFAGTAPAGTVSVGSAGSERTITNVAAGQLNSTSTDAINGSQLYATNQAIEAIETSVGEFDEIAVKYDKNADGSKANSVTLVGGDPNAPVVLSNVAAGGADTDAVNVKQLKEVKSYTDTQVDYAIMTANNYTDNVATNTLNEANAYTDNKFNQLNSEIGGVRDEARQAAAIGLAAASLRYDDRPGKLSAAIGNGYWRGEGAFAVGAGYTSEDGRLRTNISSTSAGGKWGVGGGLSYTFN